MLRAGILNEHILLIMSNCNGVDNTAGNSAKSNNDQLTCTAGNRTNQNGEMKPANSIARRRSVSSIIPRVDPTNEALQIASSHTFDLHNLSSSYHSLVFADRGINDIFEPCTHNVEPIGANGLKDTNYFSEPPTVSSSKHDADMTQANSSPEVKCNIKPWTEPSRNQDVELIETHSSTYTQNIIKRCNESSSDHDVELIPARGFADVFDPSIVSSNNQSVELIRAHNSPDTQYILEPCCMSYRRSDNNVGSMPTLTDGHDLSKQHYLSSSNKKDALVQTDSFTDTHSISEPCMNLSVGNTDTQLVKEGISTDDNDIIDIYIASFSNNQAELAQEGSFTDDHHTSSNSEVELVEGDIITDSDSDDDAYTKPCAYSRKYEEKWVGPESVIDTSHMSELGNVFFVNDQFELIEEDSFEDAYHMVELANMSLRNNQAELEQEGSFTDSIRNSERGSNPSVCNIEVELVKAGILKHVHGINDLENASFSGSQVELVQEDSFKNASNIVELGNAAFSGNQVELFHNDSFTDEYNTELGSASFSSNQIVLTQEGEVTDAYNAELDSTSFSSNQIVLTQEGSFTDAHNTELDSTSFSSNQIVLTQEGRVTDAYNAELDSTPFNNNKIVLVQAKCSRVTQGTFGTSSTSRNCNVELVQAHSLTDVRISRPENNKDELTSLQTNNPTMACDVFEPSYPSSSNKGDEMSAVDGVVAPLHTNEARNSNSLPTRPGNNVGVGTLRLDGGSTEPDRPPHCRFCQLGDQRETLIAPCHCRGALAYIHYSCLTRYLNQGERNTCQLCSFRFNTVATRRYSLCQSLRIWSQHPRNRPHLATILVTTTLLTICVGGMVAMVLFRMHLATTEEAKYWANRPLCALIVILVLIVYVITLILLLRDQFRPWYLWWNRCVNIAVIIDPETWQARTSGPPNAKFPAGHSLRSNPSNDS